MWRRGGNAHREAVVDHACIQRAHERVDEETATPPQTATGAAPAVLGPDAIDPRRLETHRIAGSKMITPDDDVKTEIASPHVARTSPKIRLCVDVHGVRGEVTVARSSWFPRHDVAIVERIRGAWRYSPYEVGGVAKPVCTEVTFIYSQR